MTNVPSAFGSWLKERAKSTGTEVVEITNFDDVPKESVDDIVLLGADADLIEKASPYLGQFGMFAVIADKPMTRKVSVDVGRIHYMRWGYIGSQERILPKLISAIPSVLHSSQAVQHGLLGQAVLLDECMYSEQSNFKIIRQP
jgi:hypothetical protein